MSFPPYGRTLCELIVARKFEDWAKVAAIIDWPEAHLESTEWR